MIEERSPLSLCKALEIQANDIVSFVGAGGKTSAIMQLARELAGQHMRILVTTTTKILEPLPSPDEALLLAEGVEKALAELPRLFASASVVILAQKRLESEPIKLNWLGPGYPVALRPYKLAGMPATWIAPLATQSGAHVTLIEADGANHRMLKVPNVYEPVIPPCSTIVVPMADMEVLGKPLTDEFVHRPALLCDLVGVPIGSPISPEITAIALAHPRGGLKGVPPGARVVPLLTTHTPAFDRDTLKKVPPLLFLSPHIRRVVAAYLRSTPVITEVFER